MSNKEYHSPQYYAQEFCKNIKHYLERSGRGSGWPINSFGQGHVRLEFSPIKCNLEIIIENPSQILTKITLEGGGKPLNLTKKIRIARSKDGRISPNRPIDFFVDFLLPNIKKYYSKSTNSE
jgi:hypothetical protein